MSCTKVDEITGYLPHPVQNSTGQCGLILLRIGMPRAQLAAEDLLVSKEGVLDATLAMIAGLLLPFPSPHRIYFEHCRAPRRER